MLLRPLTAILTLFTATLTVAQAGASEGTPPSLLVGSQTFEQIRTSKDPQIKALVSLLREQAKAEAASPTSQRIVIGRRMLQTSRKVFDRMILWGLLYQIDGDKKWAIRANKELLAVAEFEDWNPSHFLDTAEMAAAISIGLDWFGDALPKTTQQTLREVLVTHALNPANNEEQWWKHSHSNWNQVCYGGLILAALTVKDSHPQQAQLLLQEAQANILKGLTSYAPDGAYPEGPMYWTYGTAYTLLTIEALRHKLDTDWGLPIMPGFMESGNYMNHVFAPTGQWVNYSDCKDAKGSIALLAWFAREAKDPTLSWIHEKRLNDVISGKLNPTRWLFIALLWHSSNTTPRPPEKNSWFGQGPNAVVFHRQSWNNPDSAFISIKAGSGQNDHAHLDAGSFVFEVNGIRWAKESDSQPYHSLESRDLDIWDKQNDSDRWTVFRLNNYSHNTLTIDHQPHDAEAQAFFLENTPGKSMVDLSGPLKVSSAQRSIWLKDDYLMIRDDISGLSPETPVKWNWLTEAHIEVNDREATLTQSGKSITLKADGEDPGSWKIIKVNSILADYDDPMPGHYLLQWHTKATATGELTIPITVQWNKNTTPAIPSTPGSAGD